MSNGDIKLMFDELKRIYDALSDDQSKFIFSQRLQYSMTNEQEHIRNIIKHEIEYYSEKDQMYRLINWMREKFGKIILFGAGFAGYQIVTTLADYGYDIDFICDNNNSLWGEQKFGKVVISPEDMIKMNDENLLIIIGVNAGRVEVTRQLLDLGIKIDNIFVPIRDWWIGPYDQYFDMEILPRPSKMEVFIDGGALDGEDTRRFLEWNDRKGLSYLLEPDSDNVIKIKNNTTSLQGINILEKGLWDSSTILKFNSGDKENSSISEEGNVEIQTTSIDEIDTPAPITFIKMDIEGSEGKALLGARKTITENKPKLAICVYHKPEDIIELPQIVLDMNPNYKLYLRHYSYTDTETVLYAIDE